jgi:hypothetical protein
MLHKWCVCWVLSMTCGFAFSAQPMRYIYPPPESGADVRMNFYWDVLEAALKATVGKYGPYELATGPKMMNPARAEIQLTHSSEITLMVRTTSMEREKTLLPIRIPLDKGLTGYRVFLIQAATQEKLATVRTLTDLKAFSIGQGAQWVDTDILRAAGLTVVTGGNYATLFNMLETGRFDLFSRGVNEVGQEFTSGVLTNSQLAVEKNLILYYPLPRYFFFPRTPEGALLAERVETGLRSLIKNGEFERRYQVFKKDVLKGLKLSGRHLFTIANPSLSPQTPLTDSTLWDNLSKELKATP